ncbi:MAG: DUF1156 domain-containing protein [Promicromonosporaceae bacterium]|nr:DUF1156 domain-containing protein [Promicromonosporaceae bacterium]
MQSHRKKLIEVSLPLEKINAEASREKSIRHGHPSTLHLYWARRPLAAARAVLFAQLVDDPSSRPDLFPTTAEQDAERARLHELIEALVVWENTDPNKKGIPLPLTLGPDKTATSAELFELAQAEIRKSNDGELPPVLDPFAGGGSIPLEAQRLGLEAHASDLNPLAVLINKALIEIPSKFAGQPPVFPGAADPLGADDGGIADAQTAKRTRFVSNSPSQRPPTTASNGTVSINLWPRATGLAEDVRRYGQWMRDEAEKRIGHLYPKVKGPDGKEHTVIAWIWARTVKSPNPANPIEVPLVRSWWLSKKKGKEAWVEARVVAGSANQGAADGGIADAQTAIRTRSESNSPSQHPPTTTSLGKLSADGPHIEYVVHNDTNGPTGDDDGTIGRKGAVAISDGTPLTFDYVRAESRAGRMGNQLMAVVAEGAKGRIYLSPSALQWQTALVQKPVNVPEGDIFDWPGRINVFRYGITNWADLFTNRQLVALTTLSDLVGEAREKAKTDYHRAEGERYHARIEQGLPPHFRCGTSTKRSANERADAVATYLALAVSRLADYSSSITSWNNARDGLRNVFGRQAIPMVWDFAEANPFSDSSGNFLGQADWISKVIERTPAESGGEAHQADAATRDYTGMVISTDPPYYDNIGYSDLSDFFYVWLRRSLIDIYPDVIGTMLTPKSAELVANPYRHDGKEGATNFFIEGFNQVFSRIRAGVEMPTERCVELASESPPAKGKTHRYIDVRVGVLDVPMTVYYAYKQQDASADGSSSTGWHTLLDGLIGAGWEITATWPMRSELGNRMLASGTNALASSIVLACRARLETAPATTRRAFVAALKSELPGALRNMMKGDIAPVDLAQAAIGPGISVFSRYSRVREADGSDMSVKDALLLINSTLDEVLDEQEGDFDPDTRFAVKWYRQFGWAQESAGLADQLARSSDTSIGGLERGGIFEAKGGKARLLPPRELIGTARIITAADAAPTTMFADVGDLTFADIGKAGEIGWNPLSDVRLSVWEATVRLAGLLAESGADAVGALLPAVSKRVSLDAVKELGFLLFHEAEKKGNTKDALLFNSLITAWGDVTEQARRLGPTRSIQDQLDFEIEDSGSL